MNRLFLLISLTCLITITGQVFGQSEVAFDTTIVHQDGRVMRIRINGTDTVVVATMPEVVIKAPPVFSNDEEYRQYMRYRRYAMDVLPYAIESIRLYRKYEAETEGMKTERLRNMPKPSKRTSRMSLQIRSKTCPAPRVKSWSK